MGWADCGTDSKGRPIGYGHQGTCDEPGCSERIDRGLGRACGGMHGEAGYGCEKYFCQAHRRHVVKDPEDDRYLNVCAGCHALALEDGYDDETETWKG